MDPAEHVTESGLAKAAPSRALYLTLIIEGGLLFVFVALTFARPHMGIAGIAVSLGAALTAGGMLTTVTAFRQWSRKRPGRGHFWRALFGFGYGMNLMVNLDWRDDFLETGLVLAACFAVGLFVAGFFYRHGATAAERADWITIALGGAMLQFALAGLFFDAALEYVSFSRAFAAGAGAYGVILIVSAFRLRASGQSGN